MITSSDFLPIKVFSDLPEADLAWLAAQGEDVRLEAGGTLFVTGDSADYMYVLFEGEIEMRSEGTGVEAFVFRAQNGHVTGALPYSRLTRLMGTGRAVIAARIGKFPKTIFPEMLRRMPVLAERLVGLMMDRVRESTKSDQQRDKLMALGKLSAGLAHELNNPASAAQRAAGSLRGVRDQLRAAYLLLDRRDLSLPQREYIGEFERCALEAASACSAVPQSSLEQSDKEDQLTTWLDGHSVPDSWKISQILVEAGIDPAKLKEIQEKIGSEAMSDALNRVSLALLGMRLISEIEQSTARIMDLVKAVKEYTYMDQAPEQEIDIHDGIEGTLTIMAYKIRHKSIDVVREYDRTLPKICAWGSELNQVWTNLIDNAIDAMNEGDKLKIRTSKAGSHVLVEVRDSGSGIPPAVVPRIFEPFFTTKGVGEGTGLGLDTARRIVLKHRGDIQVESKPGDTCFRISLPLQKENSL